MSACWKDNCMLTAAYIPASFMSQQTHPHHVSGVVTTTTSSWTAAAHTNKSALSGECDITFMCVKVTARVNCHLHSSDNRGSKGRVAKGIGHIINPETISLIFNRPTVIEMLCCFCAKVYFYWLIIQATLLTSKLMFSKFFL